MDRGLRTKRDILEGIFSLLEEKPFEKITVSEICDRTQIARQTFYFHFRDKYDAASWFVLSHVREIFSRLGTEIGWREAFLEDFRFVEKNRERILLMSETLDYNSITNHAARTAIEDYTASYLKRYGKEPSELIAYQIERFAHFASETTRSWMEGGCPRGADCYVDYFITLVPRELFGALEVPAPCAPRS